ncbi:translation initiation factor IF-2-like [Parus major]|uniref:translation initiation factor IF-2-like n=1 Tax=Parus major TaxID=9157 RepID=UPI0007711888|nr:translation initiation factor IF-2-like [Parus major]
MARKAELEGPYSPLPLREVSGRHVGNPLTSVVVPGHPRPQARQDRSNEGTARHRVRTGTHRVRTGTPGTGAEGKHMQRPGRRPQSPGCLRSWARPDRRNEGTARHRVRTGTPGTEAEQNTCKTWQKPGSSGHQGTPGPGRPRALPDRSSGGEQLSTGSEPERMEQRLENWRERLCNMDCSIHCHQEPGFVSWMTSL